MNTQLEWFESSQLERLLNIESEPNPAPISTKKIYVDALGIEWGYPTYAPLRPIFEAVMLGKVATVHGEKFVGWKFDPYKQVYVGDTIPCKRLAFKNGAVYTVTEMWQGGMNQRNYDPSDSRGVFYWLCKLQPQFVGWE